jgi:EAL domain-containing protein (putative c-di-GMP-specific phosphodiesterase class I)
VAETTEREKSQAVILAVIGLGHSLHMRITAEGVETQEQLDRVAAKGCDEAQGYLFSRPVPAKAIPELIDRLQSRPTIRSIAS